MLRRLIVSLLSLAVLAAALAVPTLVGCGPGRELTLSAAPGVPDPDPSCATAGASRCAGAVPEVCSASHRWWPATPAGARCPWGCVVTPAGAACGPAPVDGGAP